MTNYWTQKTSDFGSIADNTYENGELLVKSSWSEKKLSPLALQYFACQIYSAMLRSNCFKVNNKHRIGNEPA